MESTTDEVPAKRKRIEGNEKTQIPQETMLEVLLWLDRFDLDGKQITTRRLGSLVENNQMPLRNVARVDYDGEPRGHGDPSAKRNTLRILLAVNRPAEVELQIETDADAEKAASYLSSCFVSDFNAYGHRDALPRNAIIAAPLLIEYLEFRRCNFVNGEKETLSDTLNGSTFRSVALIDSSIPAWQIDNKRLESLRLRGCDEVRLYPDDSMESDDDTEYFKLTEEGILNYCFTLDDGLPVAKARILRITWPSITPAFFKKVVEASKTSLLMCDVELSLDNLRFDVGNLGLGVPPTRYEEYDEYAETYERKVLYDIADHGNGIRLLVHFKSGDGEEWEVIVRHGKKDHDEFFKPEEEEDRWSPSTEYLEHKPELEGPDEWY